MGWWARKRWSFRDGARAPGPESITAIVSVSRGWCFILVSCGYGFRARDFVAPRNDQRVVNAPPPVCVGLREPFVFFRSPKKMRGSRAPTGAGAERRTRGPPRGQTHLGIARDHRPMTRAGAPFGALLRRSPYGVGPRFRRWREVSPPIVSQLLAGDHSIPRRSPDAARVHAVRSAHPRAPPQYEARNYRAPAAGLRTCSPAPPPACSAITTPHESAPRLSRVR